jgi:hypothetical protein
MAKKNVFSDLIKAENVVTSPQTSLKITVYPELKAYIPPLTTEEFGLLEQNILQEGCREALILWQKSDEFVLVDGHNRYEICQKHNLTYQTIIKNFENIEEVKMWMISNQLGKRNITEEIKSYLRGLQYKNEKNQYGGNRKSGEQGTNLKTHERLAQEHQVSTKTIQRDEQFFEGLELIGKEDKTLQWKILNREINVPKKVIMSLPEKEADFLVDLLQELKNGTFKISKEKVATDNQETTKQHKKEFEKLLVAFFENKTKANLIALQNKLEELEKLIK